MMLFIQHKWTLQHLNINEKEIKPTYEKEKDFKTLYVFVISFCTKIRSFILSLLRSTSYIKIGGCIRFYIHVV